MVFNFQGSAVFGVLAFLGTGLLLFLAAAAFLFLLLGRRRKAAFGVAATAELVLAAYGATLLAFSFRSKEQLVTLKREKYFCEVDCHLAYSVRDVEKRRALGPPGSEVRAGGTFYVVTLRTRFDEETISSRRGNFPLRPSPRRIAVLDGLGRRFVLTREGEQALRRSGAASVPLTRPLRPGESYATKLVFDLPKDAEEPRLLLTERSIITRFLIGHENSFLHKKSSFELSRRRADRGFQSTRTSDFAVPIRPVALSRTLTTTR